VSLVGKFFFCHGAEYSQSGEVVEELGPDLLLLKFDKREGVPTGATSVFEIAAFLAELSPDGILVSPWEFFVSRKELDAYVNWLFTETPAAKKPKIVKLHS
jgi:hypothetical protein